jgi:hypothetical protein
MFHSVLLAMIVRGNDDSGTYSAFFGTFSAMEASG